MRLSSPMGFSEARRKPFLLTHLALFRRSLLRAVLRDEAMYLKELDSDIEVLWEESYSCKSRSMDGGY